MGMIYGYDITIYGGEKGRDDCRASIGLWPEQVDQQVGRRRLGFIKFHDPGMAFPRDSVSGDGTIYMHLSSGRLRNVIDILRNEEPVYIHSYRSQVFWLSTSEEPVGEAE